ncbi:MAG: 30S ribosomal protein S4 [Candidatus Margulisiibacteriota bacterium]
MARYRDANCKICRRNKVKLFLKGARCLTAKCAIEKRNFPPGPRVGIPKKMSEYGRRLREKQKLRFFYGVSEKQIRNYFEKAVSQKGVTGTNLLAHFEKRLDNLLCRVALAPSRKEARQLVRHRHIFLNGKQVDIPSIIVKPGDVVSVAPASVEALKKRFEFVKGQLMPTWLAFEDATHSFKVLHTPERTEMDVPVEEQLVVEFYSR